MSENNNNAFGSALAEVKVLPTLACLGTVTDVLEGKQTGKDGKLRGTLYWQPIQLEAVDGGRDARASICYHPEWFVKGFNPASLKKIGEGSPDDDGKTIGDRLYDQYTRHIYAVNKKGEPVMTTLRGLCGSDAAFNALSAKLVSDTVRTEKEIAEILSDFFSNGNKDKQIGYVLRQGQDATEDDEGNIVYELNNNYDVKSFFFATDENKKKKAKFAAKSGGSYRVTFEV